MGKILHLGFYDPLAEIKYFLNCESRCKQQITVSIPVILSLEEIHGFILYLRCYRYLQYLLTDYFEIR